MVFLGCASGADVPYTNVATCQPADFDIDTDVDQSDFAVLQRCFSGTGHPADADCAQ